MPSLLIESIDSDYNKSHSAITEGLAPMMFMLYIKCIHEKFRWMKISTTLANFVMQTKLVEIIFTDVVKVAILCAILTLGIKSA